MKKKNILTILAIVIILILGPTVYFRFIKPNLASASWFDDRYGYRKAVAISNSSGSALSDFQVNIGIGTSALIAQGKMPVCQRPRPTRFATRSGRVMAQPLAGRQSNCNDINVIPDRSASWRRGSGIYIDPRSSLG